MAKAKVQYNVVSIDVGYGFVKALKSLEEKPVVFHSLIAPVREGFDSGFGKKRTAIEIDGQPYYVGWDASFSKLARQTIDRDRIKTDEFKVLFLSALNRLYPSGASGLLVATGLPGGWMGDSEALSKALAGKFNVKVGSRTVGYEIAQVVPCPQVFGSWMREAFTINGNGKPTVTDAQIANEPTFLVDFGNGTTGYAFMNGAYIADYSGSVDVGMSNVISGLSQACSREFAYEPPYTELVKALITGKLNVYNKAENVSALFAPYKAEVIDKVLADVRSAWKDVIKQGRTLLLTGGGASVLGDDFRRQFGHPNTVILPDSQIANAQGLLIYGRYRAN
jgi:hypothetical protein